MPNLVGGLIILFPELYYNNMDILHHISKRVHVTCNYWFGIRLGLMYKFFGSYLS